MRRVAETILVALPTKQLTAMLGLWMLSVPLARAAGGHHAVDDAAILETRKCQVESWLDRYTGDRGSLWHTGVACRIGAIEAGVNVDRTRNAGEGGASAFGPQLKWAAPLGGGWTAGVALGASWQSGSAGYSGSSLIVPLTWQPGSGFLFHLNGGRDFRRGADGSRAGAAVEWTPLATWSAVAERFRENDSNFLRVGARWTPSPSLSVDLSRARSLGGSAPAWWTLGATWVFDR